MPVACCSTAGGATLSSVLAALMAPSRRLMITIAASIAEVISLSVLRWSMSHHSEDFPMWASFISQSAKID
jgi:hypothetical protein